MKSKGTILAAMLLVGLGAVSPTSGSTPVTEERILFHELSLLARWLSGSFSSERQAAADSNFYDIRLRMIPIWTRRTDGPWLYVEQAVAAQQDRPYRQRVYHLRQHDSERLASDVYLLPGQERFIGSWREPARFTALTPDSRELREGCTIVLELPLGGAFEGRTENGSCSSTLRGASYATSEVTITKDRLISWDRGFDADGAQVWGATEGGYIFEKTADLQETLVEGTREILMETDRAFSALSVAEGAAVAFERYAAAAATIYRDGALPIVGRDAIGELFTDGEGSELRWESTFADVAASCDLGYTLGRYEYEYIDGDGKTKISRGHYVTIWKRQADGGWKYVFDTGATAPPDADPEE